MLIIDSKTGLAESTRSLYSRNINGFTNSKVIPPESTCSRADDVAFQVDVSMYINTGFRAFAASQNWIAIRDHISGCEHCREHAKVAAGSA